MVEPVSLWLHHSAQRASEKCLLSLPPSRLNLAAIIRGAAA